MVSKMMGLHKMKLLITPIVEAMLDRGPAIALQSENMTNVAR